MAKKKSKTQKSKSKQRKRTQNYNTQTIKSNTKQTTNKKTEHKQQPVKKTQPESTKPKTTTKPVEKKQQTNQKPDKTKQLVDIDKIKYNVALTTERKPKTVTPEKKEEIKNLHKELVDTDKVKYNVVLNNYNDTLKTEEKKETSKLNKIKESIAELLSKLKKKIKKTEQKPLTKKEQYDINKQRKLNFKNNETEKTKPNNIFLRALYELKTNSHIIFNTLLVVIFVILLIGLNRTNAFTTGSIIYISCIALFLMFVAMCYTKYVSGKIFSILVAGAMCLAIYNMQYTYDFVRNLNSNEYEYKTYYVVTFNNGRNKSIYNINNKKVGLLKDNSTNIERSLNIKLDNVIYVVYEDANLLYKDFYNQETRAIIVNDNQYKYLKNNIEENSRDIKILYTFKANGRK